MVFTSLMQNQMERDILQGPRFVPFRIKRYTKRDWLGLV